MRAGLVTTFGFVVALVTTGVSISTANAQGPQSAASPFIWNSTPTPDERLSMVVNLRTQWAYVYRGGVQIADTPISSGRRGYRTPTGTFTVLEKQKHHRSNKYHNARMPFMQRLGWDGLSLHAGSVPRHPSSHGCVHLPMHFAQWLYQQPTMGMRVVITNPAAPAEPAHDSSRSLLAAADSSGEETHSSE
jgi:lipoprotein-anchoring transpeptidase ErfK/SrfK